MSQEVVKWSDKSVQESVRQYLIDSNAKLNDVEFKTFVAIGQATGLNPFMREIYALKYSDSKPASIFIGRDGYRKSAQKNKDYDFHIVDAVYANDEFLMENGEPKHKYKLANRGALVGAYAIVKRKSSTKGMYVFAELNEYYAGHKNADGTIKKGKYGDMPPTIWDTKPATMIKKVAEAQALRMAFQEVFAGTYDESEQWDEPKKAEKVEPVLMITEEQMREIKKLLAQGMMIKNPTSPIGEINEKTENAYKLQKCEKMTYDQAAGFIDNLHAKLESMKPQESDEPAEPTPSFTERVKQDVERLSKEEKYEQEAEAEALDPNAN